MLTVPVWVRLYRLIIGVLTLYAVYAAVWDSSDFGWLRYFTNQNGMLCGAVLIVGAVAFTKRPSNVTWECIRGTAVMSALITGGVYGGIVDEFFNPFDGQHDWTNSWLHQLIPIVMLIDVVIIPLGRRLPWWTIAVWLIYPLLYLGYTLVRGSQTGWYPYRFLDPDFRRAGTIGAQGMSGVLTTCALILVGFLIVAAIIMAISRMRSQREPISLGYS